MKYENYVMVYAGKRIKNKYLEKDIQFFFINVAQCLISFLAFIKM